LIRAIAQGEQKMEKRKQSLSDALNRLVTKGPARPLAEVIEDRIVTRPSPGLHHHPAGCSLTDADVALTQEVFKIYMNSGCIAGEIFRLLVLSSGRKDEERKALESIDRLRRTLASGDVDEELVHKVADLRFKVWEASQTDRMAPETRAGLLEIMNKMLDVTDLLSPFVGKIVKYCAKLQGAQLGIERVYDAAEDLQFAREIRTELDLTARE
jgi:hypothetical protein